MPLGRLDEVSAHRHRAHEPPDPVVHPPDERSHERMHVEQWRRHGRMRFLARYLYYHFRYGYWDNPFEIEARRAESASHTDPAEISFTARKA